MIKRFCLLFILAMSYSHLMAADDVDTRIPVNSEVKDKTFVLVISNENYKHEEAVPYALNDGVARCLPCIVKKLWVFQQKISSGCLMPHSTT